MLGKFGAKRNLYFLPPPCLKIVSAPLIFIDATNKFSILRKCNIARNVMWFIMNVIIKIISANLIYPFQLQLSIVLKQEFTPKLVLSRYKFFAARLIINATFA